jgi:hypothetical protein
MSRLKDILDIVSATGDESDDILLDLLKPEDMTREEAQVAFDDALGYDPTTFFDRRDIENHVESFIADDSTPENISSMVADEKATIIDDAFDIFDANRESYLRDSVAEAVYQNTGYNPSEDSIDDDEMSDDSESDDDDEDYDDMDDNE